MNVFNNNPTFTKTKTTIPNVLPYTGQDRIDALFQSYSIVASSPVSINQDLATFGVREAPYLRRVSSFNSSIYPKAFNL